jgi:hypothetical protein
MKRLTWQFRGDMLREVQAGAGNWDKLDDIKSRLEIEHADVEEYLWWLEEAIKEADSFIEELDDETLD